MTSITTTRSARQPLIATTYNPFAGPPAFGDSFPSGTPVCQSLITDGTVVPGNARSIDTACLTGLAVGAGFQGSKVFVQYAGPLALSTDQWDAIIQDGSPGGLVRGLPYYLAVDFASQSGKITATPPSGSGQVLIQVGIALSPTEMQILLGAASLNA